MTLYEKHQETQTRFDKKLVNVILKLKQNFLVGFCFLKGKVVKSIPGAQMTTIFLSSFTQRCVIIGKVKSFIYEMIDFYPIIVKKILRRVNKFSNINLKYYKIPK